MQSRRLSAIENGGQTLKVRSHGLGVSLKVVVRHPVTLEQREHDFAAAVIGQHAEGIVHNRAIRKSHIVVQNALSNFPGEPNFD